MLIDTHAHLYLKDFDEDRQEMYERAFNTGVEKVFLPNIDSATIESMMSLQVAFPERMYPMIGLHPCSVKENYKDELIIIEEWLKKENFVAVGEIGMDLYWDKTFVEQQKEAFILQLNWAVDHDIPIVIHSREATDLIIDILKSEMKSGLRGIFHCFGGSIDQAETIIELGFYLGIGGVVTFKNAGLDKTLEEIGLEHIVLETDAPYLSPAPYRGKRNESSYIKLIAERVAAVKKTTLEEVGRVTSENALKVFGLVDEN